MEENQYITQRYSYIPEIYESLIASQKNGDIMACGGYHWGTIEKIEKKQDDPELDPYLLVTFKKVNKVVKEG